MLDFQSALLSKLCPWCKLIKDFINSAGVSDFLKEMSSKKLAFCSLCKCQDNMYLFSIILFHKIGG